MLANLGMLSRRSAIALRMLAAAGLLVALGPARAQSLKELYDAARAYDATYLAAQANARSADYRVQQAEALNRPTLGLAASATHTQTDLPPPAGLPGTDKTFGLNSTEAGLKGTYSIYNGVNRPTIEQARRAAEAARDDLAAAEQDLAVRLATAYFNVLGAQDTLTTAQANKKAIAEQLASAKRNFEVGTATITDTREAQARYDLATAQEIAADNDLRTNRIALDQLVGRTGVTPVALASPVTIPATSPDNVEDWVTRADSSHPAIRKAQLGTEIADLEVEKARAANRPTLDAIATLGAQHNSGSGAQYPGTTKNASIGVQFAMPIYTGGANDGRIGETAALLERSRNDYDFARRTVAQATRQAFFGVQSGLAQVKALEAAEASSKLALEATLTGYKVGVRVNLDVLNAQSQLYSTERDLARARYDAIVNSLRLRQAAGVLGPTDIEAVNALLAR